MPLTPLFFLQLAASPAASIFSLLFRDFFLGRVCSNTTMVVLFISVQTVLFTTLWDASLEGGKGVGFDQRSFLMNCQSLYPV